MCLVDQGNVIDAFDLHDSSLYMLCSSDNTMYIADISAGHIVNQISLLPEYMLSDISVSIDNDVLYILRDSETLYMVNLTDATIIAQADIDTDSNGFTGIEGDGGGVPGEDENSQPPLYDIAKIDDSIYFIKGDNRSIYVSQVDIREWKPITVDDIFARSACSAAFQTIFYYTNIVVNSEYSYITGAKDFTFANNKLGAYITDAYVGFIDIEDGVFDRKVLHEKQLINNLHAGGITTFKGEFIIGRGQDLIVVSAETKSITETIDISTKIEDYDILSIASRGDTLYVLTTLGKIYMFDDVHSDVVGVVQLDQFNADMSKICVLDSERVYVSHIADSDHFIYEMSLFDGSIIAKSSISRDSMIAMDMLYEEFYTLDIGGTGILINWRKEERKIEV
jgi:WD40 repeat protein